MDTILASIRRILNEDEAAPAEAAKERPTDDVLILEDSMLAGPEPSKTAPPDAPAPAVPEPAAREPAVVEPVERREPFLRAGAPLPIPPVPVDAEPQPGTFASRLQTGRGDDDEATDRAAFEELIAARTRAAAEQSFGALHAALRQADEAAVRPATTGPMLLRSGGPSLEDLVRQELRGLLSAWLDQHLPGLVETLVRSQIEKMVRRGG